jgi:hypothetical protein
MSVRGYTFAVDWSQSGSFDRVLEDLSGRVDPGTIEIVVGRESQKTTAHAVPGRMGITLSNNADRYLSPENASSPIYGNILPGRRAQLRTTAGTAETMLIDGVLTALSIAADGGGNPFTAEVSDGYARLGAAKLSTPLYTGYRTGDAINAILDLIEWPGLRSIDPGATLMPYWWVEGDDPATAINNLVDAEGPPSIAYIQGSTFYFHDRHHRILNARSQTSQGTFTHIIPAGAGPGGDYKIESGSFVYDHGLADITNSVTYAVDVRIPGKSAEVWGLDDGFSINSGDTITITAQASDLFTDASVNISTTATVTTSLDRTSGRAATITLACTGAGYVSHLGLQAIPIPVSRTVKVSASDAGSVARFGEQIWPDDVPQYVDQYDALAIANRIVAGYATNRPTVTFAIAGYNSATKAIIASLLVSDRIAVRNDSIGLNAEFMVERLTYRITQLDLIELVIGASITDPVQSTGAFTFDTSGLGFDQGSFATNGIDATSTVFLFDVAGQGFDQGLFAN